MRYHLQKNHLSYLFISLLLITTSCDLISGNEQEPAKYTVMVYAAGDNSLSWALLNDLEEMEAVGSSESSNIVLQTEYSPEYIGNNNDCGPECFNRPNFNTFRYFVQKTEQGAPLGPDGKVKDIGNRDMTSPDELTEFIQWSKEKYPAENYVLVLANHGGAFGGIFEDHTSADKNHLMGLGELRSGLKKANTHFDLITFEACLMGGAETLYTVRGLADYVVFSEADVLPSGLPFTPILSVVHNNPTITPRQFAKTFVDRYVAYYENGSSSATMSAADMSVFNTFVDSWDTFSDVMVNTADKAPTELSKIIPNVTQFNYPYQRDLGHFLAILNESYSNNYQLHQIIGELQSEMSGLIFEHQSYTGSSFGATDVRNTHGLSVTLPLGGSQNRLQAKGQSSFENYKSLYAPLVWTEFLEKWIGGSGGIEVIEQGPNNRLDLALDWGKQIETGADLDLWVLEPNGDLFIPYLGTITPNASFTPSSQEADHPYEEYITNRYVQKGTYYFFSALWSDPENIDPSYEIVYQFSGNGDFTPLYPDHKPTLSDHDSWYNDPTPTLEEAANGEYADLELAATWEAGSVELTPQQSQNKIKRSTPTGPLLTPQQKRWLKQASQNSKVQKAIQKIRQKSNQSSKPMK